MFVMPPKPATLLRRAILIGWALVIGTAPGEPEPTPGVLSHVRIDRHDAGPGIVHQRVVETTPRGEVVTNLVEVDCTGPLSSVQPGLPKAGPWKSAPARELQASGHGLATFVLDSPPPGRQTPPTGLLVLGSRPVACPPVPGPHLLLRGDGSGELRDFPPAPALVMTAGETTRTLVMNRVSDFSVVSGPFDGRGLEAADWPSTTTATLLRPIRRRRADSLGDATALAFEPVPQGELEGLGLAQGEWAMLTAPGKPLPTTPFTISLSWPGDDPFAQSVAPAGSWLLRSGRVVPSARDNSPGDDHVVRTAFGIDPERQRLILAESGLPGENKLSLSRERFAALLRSEGVRDAVEFAPGIPRLLWPKGTDPAEAPAATTEARVALLVLDRGARYQTAPGDEFVRVPPSAITSTGGEPLNNGPQALLDGRMGESRRLDTYWEAPQPASGRETSLLLTFAPAVPLDALDLVHAQNCGFTPVFNLRSFRLSQLDRADGRWVRVAEVRHETPVARERILLDPSRKVYQLRLEVVEPDFEPGGTTTRMAELIPLQAARP